MSEIRRSLSYSGTGLLSVYEKGRYGTHRYHAFLVCAHLWWNELPHELRLAKDPNMFKGVLKPHRFKDALSLVYLCVIILCDIDL